LDSRAFEGPGDELARPHDNCYWLLPGRLLAGEFPGAADAALQRQRLNDLLAAGVRQVLNLTEASEPLPDYRAALQKAAATLGLQVDVQRHPIVDYGLPDVATMRRILHGVDTALRTDRPLYLHCHGGIGRTGTVVGCLLVQHGFTGEEALALIARKWQVMAKRDRAPDSPETEAQRDFIRRWAALR
jgi:hypothetical protein